MKKYGLIVSVILMFFGFMSCSQPNSDSPTDSSNKITQSVEDTYIGKWNRFCDGTARVEIDITSNELSGFVNYHYRNGTYKLVFAGTNWTADKTEGLTADITFEDIERDFPNKQEGKIKGYFKNPEKTILQLEFYEIKEYYHFPDRFYLADKVFY